MNKVLLGSFGCLLLFSSCLSIKVSQSTVGMGWSQNSVNTVIFRNQALCSYKDYQYVAYYNAAGEMVLGKRTLGDSKWELSTTPYRGNVKDAHNSISMAVDAKGFLHVSWDQHNTPL